MILVGEVKDFTPTRNGHRLVVKHLPDFPLLLDEGLYRRLPRRFENELALWEVDEAFHLIAVATFGMNTAGLATVEEVALMVANVWPAPSARGL